MSRVLVAHPSELQYFDQPIVFLNGPIQGAADWQSQAIELLSIRDPRIVIANPRRAHYNDTEADYAAQVDWETYFRNQARGGVNLFWLAKEAQHDCSRAYAQTTRGELFESKERYCLRPHRAQMVVGIEEGFTGARYIRRRFAQDCSSVPILSTLEDTCNAALSLLPSSVWTIP